MSSRRGEPLAQRVANTRARQDPPAAPEVRHCWYVGPCGRQAALLLSWRRTTPDAPWEGYIAVVAPDEAGGWSLVTMWVSAAMLEPRD
ncbi:hypothetical protein [Nocardioides gansuensis]|nr:hypothetical protein [Nocardioides gansuensis]